MTKNFTAVIEKDPESGMYVGIVPHLTGAHTYAATIDELQIRLAEVIALCLEEIEPDAIAGFCGNHANRGHRMTKLILVSAQHPLNDWDVTVYGITTNITERKKQVIALKNEQ